MKVIAYVETGHVGSRVEREVEIPDDELEGLTEQEQATFITEYVRDEIAEMYEWGWEPAED